MDGLWLKNKKIARAFFEKTYVLYVKFVKTRELRYLGNSTSDHRNEKRKHSAIQSTPQNLGKLTSETTFGHSKVVFQPLLRTKRAFFP